jgi:hypothetical protein
LLRFGAAVGPVEEFDRVEDRQAGGGADLGEAADIAGGDEVGAGGLDVGDLAVAEADGDFRLEHVVGAGGAAAEVALGGLADGEAGAGKERLRRGPDLLAMLQGAGGVVGDGQLRR